MFLALWLSASLLSPSVDTVTSLAGESGQIYPLVRIGDIDIRGQHNAGVFSKDTPSNDPAGAVIANLN